MQLYVFFVQNCLLLNIFTLHTDGSTNDVVSSQIQEAEIARTTIETHDDIIPRLLLKIIFQHTCNLDKDICLRTLCCSPQKSWTLISSDCIEFVNHDGSSDYITNEWKIRSFKSPFICRRKLQSKDFDKFLRVCEIFRLFYRKIFCDKLLLRSNVDHNLLFRQRKLLQAKTSSEHDRVLQPEDKEPFHLQATEKNDKAYSSKNSTILDGLTVQQWRDFLAALQRNMSRDHVWAMLSLVSLIVVMMFAMKVCGLKPIDRSHERHLDYVFVENDHTVSIREILALKRPYLPKGLVKFSRRWRWKRKKKRVKVKERDISDPISDNSEDERLIYSQPLIDF